MSNTILFKVQRKLINTHGHSEKLLKKGNEWKWTDEHTEAFNKLKECFSKIPCLAHYNAKNKIVNTTDASTKWLGATLWQKRKWWNFKADGACQQIFSGPRKETCDKWTGIASSGLGTVTFSLILLLQTDWNINWPPSTGLTNRLAQFDINIKHIAGKHLALTDYLSLSNI